MNIPHPFPYQGSKRQLAEEILSFFPSNTPRLIEPFAGSAAISLAALAVGKVQRLLLSDKNEPLMALWSEIINHPNQLAAQYAALWHEHQRVGIDHYYMVREMFNKTQSPDYLL